MYRIIKQKVASGGLGGSSASAMLLGRGLKHVRSFSDYLFLGGQVGSNMLREEGLLIMPSRRFSSYNEKLFRIKSCLEIGKMEVLPSPPAFELASSEGELLFSEAYEEGNLKDFFHLISVYKALSEPGFYGMASIATVLNALEVNPGGKWKRPWRWFYEYLLDCCDSFEKIKVEGITFGKLAFLAHCNGANVEVFRTNQCTIDDFRKYVMNCASSNDCYMISFFDRAHLNQTGGSHISPIGGYHASRDMVLIMDVARFKYPPHWVPLTLLWKAMDTIDEVTGNYKGFMVLSRLPYDPSVLYTLSCRDESWISTVHYLTQVPIHLKSEDIKDIQHVLSVVFSSNSTNFREFIKRVAEVNSRENGSSSLRLAVQEELLEQVEETEIFKHVSKWLHSESSHFRNITPFSNKNASPEIAANIFSQEVEHAPGNPGSSGRLYCTDANAESSKANDEMHTMVVSGPVVTTTSEQGAATMVHSTHTSPSGSGSGNDIEMHLASDDVLTMLLLTLPPRTWSGIKEAKLMTEINNLVSIGNVPPLLKNEVLSLRQQLKLLMVDLDSPST